MGRRLAFYEDEAFLDSVDNETRSYTDEFGNVDSFLALSTINKPGCTATRICGGCKVCGEYDKYR